MTKRLRFTLLFLLVSGLAACATSTLYEPVGSTGYGFAEQKIEEDRYRILFKGNSLTDRETVETYLLYRAAELTVENGYDYFIVVEDETERRTNYSGTGGPTLPPYRYYGFGRPFPYYGYGYGWDPFFTDVNVREINRYTAMAMIVLGEGEKPADTPAAYDAAQVLENLGPLIQRPDPS